MSGEIYWLILATVLTALLFAPYGFNRIRRYGMACMTSIPPWGDDPFDKEWAHSAFRAHMNAIECLATFAPMVLAVHVTGSGNAVTETAAAVYFFARLVHVPACIFGIPSLRPLSFLTGLGATLTLAYQLLT